MSRPGLAVEDLTVRHAGADRPALAGVTLAVAPGELLAVVGESGSGKSTLALALTGLLPRATAIAGTIRLGEASVAAADRTALAAWRGRRVGLAFQDAFATLHPMRTIGDQLDELIARHAPRADRAERRARALALSATVGLDDAEVLLAHHPHRLSGGQRQRVGLALALAGEPDVLLADEVTSALDPPRAAAIAGLLRRLADSGLAVVAIAHDLDRIGAVADRIAVLRRGALVEAGPARARLARPASAELGELLACRPRLEANPRRLPFRGPDGRLVRPDAPDGAAEAPCDRPIADPVLAVEGLTVRHRRRIALAGLSLELRPGEILGVVGASGSGKSTLVRSLLALEPGAEGRIAIAGRDLLAARGAMLAALRRQVGLVFQDPAASLDPRWPVWRAVAEPLAVAGTGDAGTRRARSLAALAEVGLEAALAERRPHQLSGGQQQRVAIARALVLAPNLLVCDEPVSALDLAVQAGILNLLRDLRDRRGLAVLFVSHDLAAVRFVADRVLVLEAGRAVESGPVARVYAAPRHPATRALLDATPKALDAG